MKNQHIGNKAAAEYFSQKAASQWRNGNTRMEVISVGALLSIANSLIAITTLLESPEDDIATKENHGNTTDPD